MITEDRLQTIGQIPSTDEIVSILRDVLLSYKDKIKFAFLFGSYARGDFDEWSDVDIGIYFGKDVSDENRNEIRFKIEDLLYPRMVQIGYLDSDDISPIIFIEAANGVPLAMNDEDLYFNRLLKNIHIAEEMRSLGILEKD